MPKITDVKAYTKDVFTKAGLGDDVLKQVLGAFDDEKALKAFTDSFKPLPDYSHDLDDVRNKTKADKDQEYKEWFDKEKLKYNEYLGFEDELKAYRAANPNANRVPPNEGKTMTQEDIDKLVDAKLNGTLGEVLTRRDNTYMEYMELREQHMSTFGKPLDRKSFEAAYKEHPEWGSLQAAYKFWVEPEMEKVKEAKFKAEADRRYEEGVRDGFSRKQLPTDHRPNTFSPLFDRKEDVAKLGEREQESHSREAFFEGLKEANKQPV